MSEGEQGIAILVTSAAVLSLPLHLRIRSFLVASLISGIAASVLLQVADTLHRGYPDKFASIALVFGALLGIVVSAVVGAVVRLWAHNKPDNSTSPPEHPR